MYKYLFCLIIFLGILGCTPKQDHVVEPASRGLNVSINPPQITQVAIERLSARVTDLEQRVNHLENPIKPLPDYPLPRQ